MAIAGAAERTLCHLDVTSAAAAARRVTGLVTLIAEWAEAADG